MRHRSCVICPIIDTTQNTSPKSSPTITTTNDTHNGRNDVVNTTNRTSSNKNHLMLSLIVTLSVIDCVLSYVVMCDNKFVTILINHDTIVITIVNPNDKIHNVALVLLIFYEYR